MENFDFFARPLTFKYNKNDYFKSSCGGCVSLTVIGILVAYLAYLLLIMLNRQFPEIVTRKIYDENHDISYNVLRDPGVDDFNSVTPEIDSEILSNHTYFYSSFGIRDANNNLAKINNSLINFTVNEVTYDDTGKIINRPLKFNYCSKFGYFNLSQIPDLMLENTYCINDDYILKGVPGKMNSSFLEIKMSMCDYKNNNCSSVTTIQNWLKTIKIEFYYQNNVINTSLQENMISRTIEQTYWDIIPIFTKSSLIKISYDKLDSYDGYLPDFLWAKYSTTYGMIIRSIESVFNDLDNEKNLLIIRVTPSEFSNSIERRYVDVITQLAKVGGILGILFTFGNLFVIMISLFDFRLNMMNSFYNIISPDNLDKVNQSFEDFLKKHFKYIMTRYIEIYKNKNSSGNKNYQELRRSLTRGDSLFSYKDKYEIELVDQMRKEKELNSFQKFFSLKKIEMMFGCNETDRLIFVDEIMDSKELDNEKKVQIAVIENENVIQNNEINIELQQMQEDIKDKPNSNLEELVEIRKITDLNEKLADHNKNQFKSEYNNDDLFNKYFGNKSKTIYYYKYYILYEIFKFLCFDKIDFNLYEKYKKIFCACCYKRSSVNDLRSLEYKNIIQNESYFQKKCNIYDTSVEKMKLDFDLAYILKSIEDFEKFKEIIFTDEQKIFFDISVKPIIYLLDNKNSNNNLRDKDVDEDELDTQELRLFDDNLEIMFNKTILEPSDFKLFKIMGVDNEILKQVENEFNKKIRNENVNNEIKDSDTPVEELRDAERTKDLDINEMLFNKFNN